MTDIRPMNGYVIVEPEKQETTTSSGIVLPMLMDSKPQTGKIIMVSGSYTDSNGVERNCPVGREETVIYRDWSGKQYKDGDRDLLILKFEDIMAVIKK